MLLTTHGHGLATISGYRVFQTIEDDHVLVTARLVAEFDAAGDYMKALGIAQAVRRTSGAWAVVDTVYECGCSSR